MLSRKSLPLPASNSASHPSMDQPILLYLPHVSKHLASWPEHIVNPPCVLAGKS
ncbi:hypothetical protein BJV78DRAFT_1206392 [Lactifluus subvellereus]|nr:hypothetical protein BJV78DRAFT_1206392 [Lactifluus subvellereus]